MVEAGGIEPPTYRVRTECSSQLSYTSMKSLEDTLHPLLFASHPTVKGIPISQTWRSRQCHLLVKRGFLDTPSDVVQHAIYLCGYMTRNFALVGVVGPCLRVDPPQDTEQLPTAAIQVVSYHVWMTVSQYSEELSWGHIHATTSV